MPHERCACLLVIGQNRPAVKLDVAGIEPAFISINCHQPGFSAIQECVLNGLIIARQIRIAIDHEEAVAQQRNRLMNGACSAAESRTIKRVLDLQAEYIAILHDVLHHFRTIPQTEHDSG